VAVSVTDVEAEGLSVAGPLCEEPSGPGLALEKPMPVIVLMLLRDLLLLRFTADPEPVGEIVLVVELLARVLLLLRRVAAAAADVISYSGRAVPLVRLFLVILRLRVRLVAVLRDNELLRVWLLPKAGEDVLGGEFGPAAEDAREGVIASAGKISGTCAEMEAEVSSDVFEVGLVVGEAKISREGADNLLLLVLGFRSFDGVDGAGVVTATGLASVVRLAFVPVCPLLATGDAAGSTSRVDIPSALSCASTRGDILPFPNSDGGDGDGDGANSRSRVGEVLVLLCSKSSSGMGELSCSSLSGTDGRRFPPPPWIGTTTRSVRLRRC
jgi:hypothetical protein